VNFDLKQFKTKDGHAITVEISKPNGAPRRKPFKAAWVKITDEQYKRLKQAQRIATVLLFLTILFEDYRRRRLGGDIVLSASVTGLQQKTRRRAIQELTHLGLIQIEQYGKRAPRVIFILDGTDSDRKSFQLSD
jgi:hypothetical protein